VPDRWILGLDLGQSSDYSALSIVQEERAVGARQSDAHYALRHVDRTRNVPYPVIVRGVKDLIERRGLRHKARLVVDKTGVGAPCTDMLRAADLGVSITPVTITGGTRVIHEGVEYSVPKRDLVSALRVCLDGGRLHIPLLLGHGATLRAELANFKVKINLRTAHDSYEAGPSWREGEHDDLVLSLALAIWFAERGSGLPFDHVRLEPGPAETVRWPDGTETRATR
jgi:hypothetical protein